MNEEELSKVNNSHLESLSSFRAYCYSLLEVLKKRGKEKTFSYLNYLNKAIFAHYLDAIFTIFICGYQDMTVQRNAA